LQQLNKQFDTQQTMNAGRVTAKSADDVVIVSYARTAITRAKKGPQRNSGAEVMLLPVLEDVMKKGKVDPKMIEEVCIGNVLQPGAGAINSRIAQLLAGIPDCCPNFTINRQCSSGLQAVAVVANQIKSGQIEIGIGGGVESMSMYNMMGQVDAEKLSDKVFDHDQAQKCLIPMGITSENVAAKYGITREQQDKMAYESHMKAAHANKMGWSQAEITPYKTIVKDKEGEETEVTVDRDDGVRP